MPQASNTVALDEHLKDVVGALHGAVGRAMPHLDDSAVVGQTLRDCKEILDEVMAGKISDWVS
jgi:hypothetical protein